MHTQQDLNYKEGLQIYKEISEMQGEFIFENGIDEPMQFVQELQNLDSSKQREAWMSDNAALELIDELNKAQNA